MTKLLAFKDDPALAAKIRAQVQAHYDADEIIHGTYWENGKGCAVGCIIHGSNHDNFATQLGIPAEIAYLLDGLFEALPNGEAKELPRRFVNVIQPGADLSMVIPQFLLWMLSDPKIGSIADAVEADTKAFVHAVIALFAEWVRTGERPTQESVFAGAAGAAWAAWDARDARTARTADARDAWDARAAGAAWAARAAWDARTARSADARDAWDARSAWAAWAARSAGAAWAARNKAAADKLIELLAAAGSR